MVRNEKYWILSRHKFLVRPSQFARSGIRRDNKVYINKTQRLKVAQTDDGGDGGEWCLQTFRMVLRSLIERF